MTLNDLTIRTAKDEDAPQMIDLIGACYAEYEGVVLDLDDMDASLHAIHTYAAEKSGEVWVVLDEDKIVASGGYVQGKSDRLELIRFYVRDSHRRRGLASLLLDKVMEEAKRKGLGIDLWTDTRFVEAHQFYLRHGFEQQEKTRSFNDPSNTTEYQFVLDRVS